MGRAVRPEPLQGDFEMRNRRIAVLVSVALLIAGCSGDPADSEEYQELEGQLSVVQQQLDEVTGERDDLIQQIEAGAVEPFDVDAFEAAQSSGAADQIRVFYTDDAVMMPSGHILATLNSHPVPEYWDVSGPDVDREAAEHEGGTFEFLDIRQNGDMVVTTGQWTFPEGMFPDSAQTVIKTASIMHLRDGKIWRHFADFPVYVNGDLMDM